MQDDPNSLQTIDQLWTKARIPLIGIFLILLVQALVWSSQFLIPVTAAVLGYFVLNQPRRALQRWGVPSFATALLFTLGIAILIGLSLTRLTDPLLAFLENIPEMLDEIDRKIDARGGTLQAINEATEAADKILKDDGNTAALEVEVVKESGLAATIMGYAPSLFSQLFFALVLLFFLIASGDLFLVKTIESVSSFQDKRKAVEVIHTIEDRLGRYLGGITIINFGLGVAIGVAMYLWDMPNPWMFLALGFALNYIPFVGAVIGATIAAAVAFVSLDGVWPAFGVFATYMALTSLEGQFITPMLISKRMKLNTTVVFLAVAFFAWIWSVMGMIVALPILIVIKIISEELGFATLARYLSGDTTKAVDPDEEGETGSG